MDEIIESKTVTRDFMELFLGRKLGQGMSRSVYVCRQDEEHVLKIELSAGRFQNVIEWEVWETVKETKYKKWFAPCVAISPCGTILIQKRAEQLPKNQYPKKIPAFFRDIKYQNFGMINKQFVCLDYGTAHIEALNRYLNGKLIKASFWNEEAS